MTSPQAETVPDRGGALSFPVVGGVFALLLALGVGLGVTIHKSYVGFERVVARHVPPDATFVLRWDVEKVSLFEPTRRFLLPLFDEAPAGTATPGPTRRDRFAKESGSMLGRDLREALVTFGPGAGDWTLLLAGSFPSGDLVAAAERTLATEGNAWRLVAPDRLIAPNGVALGRAPDGVLAFASSSERLEAALAIHPLLPEVPRIGAGSLLLRPPAAGLPRGAAEVLEPLGAVSAIEGEAHWASPLPVEVRVHFSGAPPADAKERIHRSLGLLLGEDLPRLEKQFAPLSVEPAGNQTLRAVLLIDDMALERAANRAAGAAERGLGFGPAQE